MCVVVISGYVNDLSEFSSYYGIDDYEFLIGIGMNVYVNV